MAPLLPPPVSADADRDHRIREVVRIYERYAREVVERFDFCPWAARSRREATARPSVLFQRDLRDFSASLAAIEALDSEPSLSVGFLIYPCVSAGRLDFEHFVRQLRQADCDRREPGAVPFAMAAFHPHAAPDLSNPDRLVPFIRRSPDPTIQLVRREALESVRGELSSGTALVEVWMLSPTGLAAPEKEGVRERIAQNNLDTVRQVGSAAVEAVLADIAADRAASYARLGMPSTLAGETEI
ncbi:MAG: DUF1415 family protein [Myxococcota bacterium]